MGPKPKEAKEGGTKSVKGGNKSEKGGPPASVAGKSEKAGPAADKKPRGKSLAKKGSGAEVSVVDA